MDKADDSFVKVPFLKECLGFSVQLFEGYAWAMPACCQFVVCMLPLVASMLPACFLHVASMPEL